MRAPQQLELIETLQTDDEAIDLPDGSWAIMRRKPPGAGWHVIAPDRERCTWWQRRRPIIRPERRRWT